MPELKCPHCGKSWPADYRHCPEDGSFLDTPPLPLPREGGAGASLLSGWWMGVVAAAAILVMGVNLLPSFVQLAARQCDVSLVELRLSKGERQGTEGKVLERARKTLEEIMKSLGRGQIDQEILKRKIILVFAIRNGNFFPVTFDGMDFKLSINEKACAEGGLAPGAPTRFPARVTTQIEVPLDLSLMGMISAVGQIVLSEKLHYRAAGSITVSTWVGEIKYPFEVDSVNLSVVRDS